LKGHTTRLGRLLTGAIRQSPYARTAITVLRIRSQGISSLEGKVGLNVVDGRVVVVLDFAELQEAR